MFVKAMEIVCEESKKRRLKREIRQRLLSETGLSPDEVDVLIIETLDKEALKHAEELLARMIVESWIPASMLKRLLAGERSKTIAALRTAWRRRLYAETRLSHKEINQMLGLSGNSRHLSGGHAVTKQ
ncbi:MAG: hypothetical protein WC455_13360 [Dehalococcoidia bacterium]|jgi:hypothetical protein